MTHLLKKNTLFIVLVAVVVLALALSGCGGDNSESGDDEETLAPVNLRLVSGAEGGSWQLLGGLISEAISKNVPGSDIMVVPGGGTGNPITVGKKEMEVGIANVSYLTQAFKGGKPYDEEGPFEDLRQVMYLPAKYIFQLVVRDNMPDTLKEIIEQKYPLKYTTMQKGSTHQTYLGIVLNHYGVTPKDIESWGGGLTYASQSDAVGLFRDGIIDMLFVSEVLHVGSVSELDSAGGIKFLSLDEDLRDSLVDWGLQRGTIPGGTYKSAPEDIDTTYDVLLLFTHKDVPEDVIYSITKSVAENPDYLTDGFQSLKDFVPEEDAATETAIPMHDGAVRYYKERGWLK